MQLTKDNTLALELVKFNQLRVSAPGLSRSASPGLSRSDRYCVSPGAIISRSELLRFTLSRSARYCVSTLSGLVRSHARSHTRSHRFHLWLFTFNPFRVGMFPYTFQAINRVLQKSINSFIRVIRCTQFVIRCTKKFAYPRNSLY
jgi:hypothetical protein